MSDKYPEHDKVRAVQDEARIIGDFLEWLPSHAMVVCEIDDDGNLEMVRLSTEKLLALYFEIDMERFSAEKDEMVEAYRRSQGME